MTYQPTRSPSDVNESDVNDSPYSPSEITVSQGDLDWRIQRSQPTSTMTPTQVLLQHHRQLQAKPGEKKKSKLGYSRTPVACGPCRQRKIRCIPSTSDPQSSCENCRRLNKECTFIPTESQQGRDQSSSENTSQTAESTSSNASPPDLGAEPYLHSSQQGYHPATHPTSSIWPQSSLSPAVISADRDDIYAVPLPSANSPPVHFTLSHRSEPTYITSAIPAYMHGGALPSPETWQLQSDPSYHKYDEASPPSAVYGRPTVSTYDTRWDSAAPIRSMSYSGEISAQNNLQQYEPGHQQLAFQAIDPHGITSSLPMSSAYVPAVSSQLPSQAHVYGMMEGQPHGQYQDRNSYPTDWTYHQRDQNHDTA